MADDRGVEPEDRGPGFANYEIERLEAYLRQRNEAFGYPLRAWNGRWVAPGGASFSDFGEALEETRAQLSRSGDAG